MSRKAKKAMAVALTAGMLASTAATPVMAATAGWKQNSKGWWYENADGTYPANKWQSINGKWYYFDANGSMASGWQSINGKWYYFGGANDGAMKSGWQPIGGKWYYLGEAEDGSMKDGWFKDYTGQYSYAEPGVGAIYQDGWKQEPNGAWYYLNPDGYMVEGGWVESASKRYFLDKDGVMQSGVIKVDDAVYYLGDSNDGSVKTGEQEIGDETYTFEADGKATGDKIPEATKAFKKDGTPVALDPEERELSITGVGSITKNTSGDFVLTALLSEEAIAEDLKDSTLTLTKGSIVVTAKFDSVSGATAVYKIVDATKLTPQNSSADGKYVVTGTGIEIDSNCNDASYQETLVANAIQGFVYYVDDNNNKIVPIKDATVKVGNKTVVTDENGYYDIYSISGKRTVKVTATEFFGTEANVDVDANYASALNIKLKKYNQEELYITGTIVTEETGNAIVRGAKVELLNAKGETIATVVTDNDGKYIFQNSAESGKTDNAKADGDEVHTFGVNDANKLDESNEYKIKITKSYNAYDETSSTFVNLYDAYHEATYEVDMNQFGADTNLSRKTIRPVKALQSVTLSTTWDENATLPSVPTSQNMTVNFIDTDGKTILAYSASVPVTALDGKSMKTPAELVSTVFGTKTPTLETGTYYIVVNDGVLDTETSTAANAYCVIPVKVTEGENVAATGTIKPAASISLETKATVISNDVLALYANGNKAYVINSADAVDNTSVVSVKYDVYQKVNGTDVLIYTTDADGSVPGIQESEFSYNATEKTVNAIIGINQLVTGETYVCKPTQSHIKANNAEIDKAPSTTSTFTKTNEVKSAADIVELDFTGSKWVKADGKNASSETPKKINSIKIVRVSDNKSVAEATDLEFGAPIVQNNKNTLSTDKLQGIEVLDDDGEFIKYKAIISVDGFEPVTTEEFTLLDFQDASISYNKTMTEIAKTSVAGSIYYKDGSKLAEDASIILYDENKVVAGVAKVASGATEYKIENGTNATLSAGNYTMVVRGEGFETYTAAITLTDNKVSSQKIELEKHLGGLAKLTVRDTNNYGYGAANNNGIKLLDEYHVAVDSVLDKYDYLDYLTGNGGAQLDMDPNFIGEFGVNPIKASNIEFKSEAILSVGTYTVKIDDVPGQVKGNSSKDEVTISEVDANGSANIVLDAVTAANTKKLTVKFTSDAETTDVDGIVIEKEDGTFVDKVLDFGNGDSTDDTAVFNVGANATYIVKIYAKGKYVASQEVTVQDFDRSVSVSLDDIER